MVVLICHDVASQTPAGAKRLRRIAEACKDHGVRVQYSVFECRLDGPRWVQLRARLLAEYDEEEDSLRFYFLRDGDAGKTEHHGQRAPADPTGCLVV